MHVHEHMIIPGTTPTEALARRLHDHRVTAGCDRSGAAGTGPFALSALWLGHPPRKMAVLMGKSWEHHGKIHDQW